MCACNLSAHSTFVVWVPSFALSVFGACVQGFDLDLVEAVSSAVSIPVIASSGAGNPSHFTDVFKGTAASAALAAGIFHRKEVSISEVKGHMAESGLPTRL